MKIKLLTLALLATTSNAYAGCGSSFCAVNTQWDTQGLSHNEGFKLDVRYVYAKADTPRVGSKKVAKPLASDPNLAGAEVENQRTINQSLNVDLAYAINSQWGVTVDVPLVMRDHSHQIGDPNPALVTTEQKSFSQLGDMRVIGNYKIGNDDHLVGSGVRFGLKLPTGNTTQEMVAGTPMEAGLQPGSGSTDAILGAYHYAELANAPWGWFASTQLQMAMQLKNDYRPGDEMSVDVGAHYAVSPLLTGLLQVNAQYKKADSGTALNMNPHTGGRSLNLSPGVSIAVAPRTKLYSFVQLPLYQYANPDPAGSAYGQLTAPWSFSMGVNHSF
ncbi:MAG: transporter [Gallionella sp.]